MKKLRSEKLRADFPFPIFCSDSSFGERDFLHLSTLQENRTVLVPVSVPERWF